MNAEHELLIDELIKLLNGGSAHAGLAAALDKLPAKLRGQRVDGLPYSIWQLVEHIRIAQWDMLQFCIYPKHQSPEWPEGYWPDETEPANEQAWIASIEQIEADLKQFITLLKTEDLYKKIPGGTGQTILKEALQIADHNAYHIAEIIVMRRLLKAWH
ncbi:MAG: DinB family protein [Mucilaginibacter sp.]